MSSNEVIENDEKSCGITLLLSVPLLISFNRNCSFSSSKDLLEVFTCENIFANKLGVAGDDVSAAKFS